MKDNKALYKDPKAPLEERVQNLVEQLTLEEKFELLSGHTNFTTAPIPRLGIPEFGMTDGPHGVGFHSSNKGKNTYFPAAIGIAASWNPEMAEKFGVALAEETRANNRHCILAPGMNICRTPLNGRTFEYLSEDPYLNSKLVVPIIKGVQSQRIAACAKHFYCNNTEFRRKFTNSIVDERTLEEIYWPAFKAAIQEAGVWTLMGAYNLMNGKYIYDNVEIMKNKVCGEWGFKNAMMSDWTATHAMQDAAACIHSKMSLEMPRAIVYTKENLRKAFEEKRFSEIELNDCTARLVKVMMLVGLLDPADSIPKGNKNSPEHFEIARKMAEESAVLLKNEHNILPLDLKKVKTICLTGDLKDNTFAPMAWGGSSGVVPLNKMVSVKAGLTAKLKQIAPDVKLVDKPQGADVAIVVTGWTHFVWNDSEGQERKGLELGKGKVKMIQKVAQQNPNTIVVLFGGSACTMDGWLDKISGLLAVWQPHQEGGHAIANLLFGETCPSGKLPISFPKKRSDSPAHNPEYAPDRAYPNRKYGLIEMLKYELIYHNNSPKRNIKPLDVNYDEGIFVGYRHYDTKNVEPLFPFGFGLSYTTFALSDFALDKKQIKAKESLSVSVKIKNTGTTAGSEVIQVYVSDIKASVPRPTKELCGFMKVSLSAGEEKTVQIPIDTNKFSFFDVKTHKWITEAGEFKILVGTSSRNLQFEQIVNYQ